MTTLSAAAPASPFKKTSFIILFSASGAHLLNDLMQSMLPAIYPLLKEAYALDYVQIGFLTLAQQIMASLLQPLIGLLGDRKHSPLALPIGMGVTLAGVTILAFASAFWALMLAAALMGFGSAVFHPEASRIARQASGGRLGLAQSLFQVGGNVGAALAPLAAAFVILQRGQHSVSWFTAAAVIAIMLLIYMSVWYTREHRAMPTPSVTTTSKAARPRAQTVLALTVICALLLSKYVYLSSIQSYYSFYLIEKFGLSAAQAQLYLFVFLGAVAAGTIIGGPVGDRYGRLTVIWGSILGALPFTILLPFMGLTGTIVMSVLVGLILSSAFAAIVVYAQELVPGNVGMVAGLVFGFAFGIGALGAAVLGYVADYTGIIFIFQVCSFLPLLGVLTIFLPKIKI